MKAITPKHVSRPNQIILNKGVCKHSCRHNPNPPAGSSYNDILQNRAYSAHKPFHFIDIEYWKHNGASNTFEFKMFSVTGCVLNKFQFCFSMVKV